MPANRSRTAQWRRCLHQVYERNGGLEIAIARKGEAQPNSADLLWRVRILKLTDEEIVVEHPVALGRSMPIDEGVEMVCVLAVGQNRWMFRTTNRGTINVTGDARSAAAGIRLVMPEQVERCQRRNYYRVHTAALNLPTADVWPLLDPKTVLVAERSNELQFQSSQESQTSEIPAAEDNADEAIMPDVGPKFRASVLNIGGGGLGMRIPPEDAQAIARHSMFWVRFTLPPELTTPICATGKLVHTHMESTHHVYAGLAFDFTFNPAHQKFVAEQISKFIAIQQREQMDDRRKSA